MTSNPKQTKKIKKEKHVFFQALGMPWGSKSQETRGFSGIQPSRDLTIKENQSFFKVLDVIKPKDFVKKVSALNPRVK